MFDAFNRLHPSISFTMEVEQDGCLPFLDVSVQRAETNFVTSLFRKSTFTAQYINYLSHCTRRRKINLIKTLCHRAVSICSPSTLDDELKMITKILVDNGYPENLIVKTIKYHRQKMVEPRMIGPTRCPVPIKLPYVGSASDKVEKDIRNLTRKCFYSVDPRVIFSSAPIMSHCFKDRIPTNDTSMVIYHFRCYCDSSYVGKTVRRLSDRISEHIPRCVKKFYSEKSGEDYKTIPMLYKASKKSSVAEHLLENPECGENIAKCNFSILRRCESKFRLDIAEPVIIAAMEPNLCKQTEFDFVTAFV